MFEQLESAISLGMVQVVAHREGYLIHGARGDLILEAELEQAGAELIKTLDAYYLKPDAAHGIEHARLRQLQRKTSAVQAALAARAARAREQGMRLFDNQRARQQRKITRQIKEIYQQAMLEHAQQIKRIESILSAGKPPDMEPAEWAAIVARRKNTLAELNAVYDELAAGLSAAGESAQKIMNAQLQESAAISRKVAAWQVENMTGVQIYRFVAHDTATLAATGIATYHGKFDLKAWQGVSDRNECRQVIKKAVMRGLLTGEHPEKIARRIEGVFNGNEPLSPHKRAVRIARTETASIMAEATQEQFRAAQEIGVKIKNRWDATLDRKTRKSHRQVDGEVVEIGEKFSNGLRRPSEGSAADRINCRCTLTAVVEGFEPNAPMRRDNETGKLIPYMTYSQWERTLAPRAQQ